MAPKLKFYNVKSKKSFETTIYDLEERKISTGKRYFAIALAPTGNLAYRIVSKDFYDKNKK